MARWPTPPMTKSSATGRRHRTDQAARTVAARNFSELFRACGRHAPMALKNTTAGPFRTRMADSGPVPKEEIIHAFLSC